MSIKFIKNKKFKYESKTINIDDIAYISNNIRINDKIPAGKTISNITQSDIHKVMLEEDSVVSLRSTLIKNGGLLDQIYVIESEHNPHIKSFNKKYVVIEGNSRLCIFKEQLKNTSSDIWSKISCDVLLGEIPELEIKEIMRIFHKKGKTPWRPANKARDLLEQLPNGLKSLDSTNEDDRKKVNTLLKTESMRIEKLDKVVHAITYHDEYKQTFHNHGRKPPYEAIEEVFSKKGLIKHGLKSEKNVRERILDVLLENPGTSHRAPIETINKICSKMDKHAKSFFDNELDVDDLEEILKGKTGKTNITFRTKDFAKFLQNSRVAPDIDKLDKHGLNSLANDLKIVYEKAFEHRNRVLKKLNKAEKVMAVTQKDKKKSKIK